MEQHGRSLRFNVMVPGKLISAICTSCGEQFCYSVVKNHDEQILAIRAMFAEHICDGLFLLPHDAIYRRPS